MSQPLYKDIARSIIEKINAGAYLENQKLPSERQLAQEYNVSRFTINSALNYLENQKIIYTIHGSGSYVATKTVPISLNSFYSFDIETSKHDSPITNSILTCEIIESNPYLSHKLKIPLNTKLYQVTRLRHAHTTPIILQTTYLPHDFVPFIDKESLITMPLYQYLQENYQLDFSYGKEFLQAHMPNAIERDLLQISERIPCLSIERFSYDEDEIVEFTISIIRGDKYAFEIEMTK